jgi:hypothetical protein
MLDLDRKLVRVLPNKISKKMMFGNYMNLIISKNTLPGFSYHDSTLRIFKYLSENELRHAQKDIHFQNTLY